MRRARPVDRRAGIRAGFNTTLRRNATDPSLRMRLMRHKSIELGLGTYDKVEVDELRRELERLPVATALRAAAGAESVTVPVTVRSGPTTADAGRSGPFDPASPAITESANGARTRGSRPALAAAGRSGPEPTAHPQNVGPAGLAGTRRGPRPRRVAPWPAGTAAPAPPGAEAVGPAGLEPAIVESEASADSRVVQRGRGETSTSASTPAAAAWRLTEAVREVLSGEPSPLSRSVRRDLARLLVEAPPE